MTSAGSFGSIQYGGTTYALTTSTEGKRPEKEPNGLIATNAIHTKNGWLGQVYVDKTIVWESNSGHDESRDAIDEANAKVVSVVSKLFSD